METGSASFTGLTTISLTDAQYKYVYKLLAHEAEKKSSTDIPTDILDMLVHAKSAADRGGSIMFLNLYAHSNQYGGPEEGGWNYTYYDLFDFASIHSLDELVEAVLGFVEYYDLDAKHTLPTDITEAWNSCVNCDTSLPATSDDERYFSITVGDVIMKVEHCVGATATLSKPIYE